MSQPRTMQSCKEEIKQALGKSYLAGYISARKDELDFLAELADYPDQRINDRINFLREEVKNG